MKEKDILEYAYNCMWLNDLGKSQYISYLKGEIIDYETRIMQDGKESDKDRRDLDKHNERIKK